MALPPFNEVNVALCEALGLDASQVKRISIYMSGDGYPSVLVEYTARWFVSQPEALNAFAQFELRPYEPKAEDAA